MVGRPSARDPLNRSLGSGGLGLKVLRSNLDSNMQWLVLSTCALMFSCPLLHYFQLPNTCPAIIQHLDELHGHSERWPQLHYNQLSDYLRRRLGLPTPPGHQRLENALRRQDRLHHTAGNLHRRTWIGMCPFPRKEVLLSTPCLNRS